ncbi:DNA primase/helicase [Streptomyces capillispiralis]|uniref:Putative DNA primase/helicase n=1 Tax=Streptomyces capillispiralis TaxID=68182 RepID=A0A561SGT5_9ACTN|nr:putative DNA primase/helicase [Streptomyces capillispiralis]GHH96442.1 DNA primase/helicase [Streptomyces capillispiralis]
MLQGTVSGAEGLLDVTDPAGRAALLAVPATEASRGPDHTSPEQLRAGPGSPGLVPDSLGDRGNAGLFVALHGRDFRYVREQGWYHWSGWRWERDEDDAVLWAVGDMAESMAEVDATGRFTTAALRRNRQRAMSTAGMKAVLAHAKDAPGIALDASSLDADAAALCTPTGVVDLRTGRMMPPDPTGRHHSRSTSVPPADIPTPRWYRFLADTFGDDAEGMRMISFLHELLGYSLTGEVTAQVIPFLYGKGKNGKSVLLEVVMRLLGDYADAAPHDFLMAQTSDGPHTGLAELHGRRMVVCSEFRSGDRLDEARVAALTGSSRITVPRPRRDSFSFRPTHKLWLIGNHWPEVDPGAVVVRRRMRVIPFERMPIDGRKVDNLAAVLVTEEGPGILQWLITGAHRYLNGTRDLAGPGSAATVASTCAEVRDPVGRFLEECCRLDSSLRVEQTQLYGAYRTWCRAEGHVPQSSRTFAVRVREAVGLSTPKNMILSNQRKFYPGIGLVAGVRATV